MARHYLYEAANVLLTTVKKRFALRNWGLRLIKTIGPSAPEWRLRESWLSCLDECGRTARTLKPSWRRASDGSFNEEEGLTDLAFRPSAMQRVRTHEGERATFGCRKDLRLIHCAARRVSASVAPDC